MNLWSVLCQKEKNLVSFRVFEKLKLLVNEWSIYNWIAYLLFYCRSDNPVSFFSCLAQTHNLN